MADSADVTPPSPNERPVDPPVVELTVESLAATVEVLQRRVAILEVAAGRATDVTIADLPDHAASILGTNPANLSAFTDEAKRKRQQERMV